MIWNGIIWLYEEIALAKNVKNSLELEIEKIVWGGKGLGRANGKVFFVEKAVPLDKIRMRVTLSKSDFGEGEIEKIIYPSKFRVSPICKDFQKCGGCQLQMVNYAQSLVIKEEIAKEILKRWTKTAKFNKIIGMETPFEYRHKGEFHLRVASSKLICGFFEAKSHKIVPFENCHLFNKNFNFKLKEIVKHLDKLPFKGSLKSLILCSSEQDEFVLVVYYEGEKEVEEQLFEKLESLKLKGIVFENRNKGKVFEKGECFINYKIEKREPFIKKDILFKVDPRTFTQASFKMNNYLVYECLRLLNLSKHNTILELFSGGGNFTLPIALNSKEVVAIEGLKLASDDSKFNASFNDITNVEHINGDVREKIFKLQKLSRKFDVVFLDPPRSGLYELIQDVVLFEPKRILYVSCSLPTLERDLRKFNEFDYLPEEFSFFDLFPQTYGIETIALLRRKN